MVRSFYKWVDDVFEYNINYAVRHFSSGNQHPPQLFWKIMVVGCIWTTIRPQLWILYQSCLLHRWSFTVDTGTPSMPTTLCADVFNSMSSVMFIPLPTLLSQLISFYIYLFTAEAEEFVYLQQRQRNLCIHSRGRGVELVARSKHFIFHYLQETQRCKSHLSFVYVVSLLYCECQFAIPPASHPSKFLLFNSGSEFIIVHGHVGEVKLSDKIYKAGMQFMV